MSTIGQDQVEAGDWRGRVEVDGGLVASLGDPACLVDRCQPRTFWHFLGMTTVIG